MENAKQTLEKIHSLIHNADLIDKAVAYGITKNDTDGTLDFKVIDEDVDVYDLIYGIADNESHIDNDFVTIKTSGWAAPLNTEGEVEGKPSEHPERRRVRLYMSADIKNKIVLGSSLQFDDDEEVVYDMNEATGSLAFAMAGLVS